MWQEIPYVVRTLLLEIERGWALVENALRLTLQVREGWS